MRVLVRNGDDLIETRSFGAEPVTIGSGADCAVRLPAHGIAARQAVLSPRDDGDWVIEVTGEGPPALLNGRRITRPMPVKNADEIAIADFSLIVYRSEDERAATPSPPRVYPSEEVAELHAHPLPPGSIVKKPNDEMHVDGPTTHWLAELAVAVRACTDIPKLIDLALERLIEDFDARFVFAGARRRDYGLLEFVHGRSIDGRVSGEPPLFDVYQCRCLDLGQAICVIGPPATEVGTAVVAPLSCSRGDLGMLYVDRKRGAAPLNAGDLDRLRLAASIVAAQLKVIILEQARIQQAAADEELAFVREIQRRMDPTTAPEWPGLQQAIYCKPGLERTGDVYDLIRLPNGLAAILVAHLSGERTRCALAMVEVRAAFRMAGLHADAPHMFLRSVNWLLCEDRVTCRMEAAAIVMNPMTGEMQFSTAGDIGAVIVDGYGGSRDLGDRSDPAVGTVPNFAYDSRFDQLQSDESLALYTGGCRTITNQAGEQLSSETFLESIRDGCRQAASIALTDLIQEHAAFFKHGRQPDDISILLFHRTGEPG